MPIFQVDNAKYHSVCWTENWWHWTGELVKSISEFCPKVFGICLLRLMDLSKRALSKDWWYVQLSVSHNVIYCLFQKEIRHFVSLMAETKNILLTSLKKNCLRWRQYLSLLRECMFLPRPNDTVQCPCPDQRFLFSILAPILSFCLSPATAEMAYLAFFSTLSQVSLYQCLSYWCPIMLYVICAFWDV